MESVKISDLHPTNIPKAVELAEAANLSPWSEQGLAEHLSHPDSVSLQVESSEKFLAFLVARFVPGSGYAPDAELLNIAVSGNERRKRFGQMLMKEFMERCHDRSVETIWLEVRASNSIAIDFYRSFGFDAVQTRRNFYREPTEDALVMRSNLKKKPV